MASSISLYSDRTTEIIFCICNFIVSFFFFIHHDPSEAAFTHYKRGYCCIKSADEEHATTGTRHFDRWTEKNRVEGVETSHAILPRGLVRIDAGKNASCNRPTGRAYEVLRVVFTCFCTVLVNKWTDTDFDSIFISKVVKFATKMRERLCCQHTQSSSGTIWSSNRLQLTQFLIFEKNAKNVKK